MAEVATKLKNWSGNYQYSTANVHHPETVEQLQTLLKRDEKFRVLGTRHCFNAIADSDENLIMLDRLERSIRVDRERKTVTISGNITYGELSPALHREGFALHNLASLAHISVAGAVATATHGSGVGNRNLATVVSQLDVVTANGELVTFSREKDGEVFDGVVVGLGAFGVVVSLTLELLPTFEVRQYAYEHLPLAQVEANFDAVMSGAYSVSLFTTWRNDDVDQVWVKRHEREPLAESSAAYFGAAPATRKMHPIADVSPENCTEQLGVSGPWHERLPHFRIDAMPSAGNELQTEYFVPRARASEAIGALRGIRDVFMPQLMVSEIRTVAADNLWMSPSYHQDAVGLHFTWQQNVPAVLDILPTIEAQLAPFQARPHWGKLFTMRPQPVRAAYEKLPQFQDLLQRYDPEGKFRNEFLNNILFGD